jgi:hypothetical protein
VLLWAALAASGCFSPVIGDGQYTCEDRGCPPGLSCTGAPDFVCVRDPSSVRPDVTAPDRPDGADSGDGDGPARLDTGLDTAEGPGAEPPPLPDGGPDLPIDTSPPDSPGSDAVSPDLPCSTMQPGDPACPVESTLVIGQNSDDDLSGIIDAEMEQAFPDMSDDLNQVLCVRDVDAATGAVDRITSVIRVDLGNLAGAQVQQATLRLFVVNDGTGVRVHEALQKWTTAATYHDAEPGVPWSVPGCADTVPGDPPCRVDPELFRGDFPSEQNFADIALPTALVQRWIDDPSSNLGLLLRIEPDDGIVGTFGFAASSGGADGQRPRLVLTVLR